MSCTDVDYKGVVYGTQLAIHFMRKNPTPGGKIVATASVAGVYPHETYPEYNGAKAAVINFARGVAPILKLVSETSHFKYVYTDRKFHEPERKHSDKHCSSGNCSYENYPPGHA